MFSQFCETISMWSIPLLLFLIPLIGHLRKVKIYECFVEGAGEGFQTAIRIMPFLVAMMVGIQVFRASGAMDWCIGLTQPLLSFLDVPPELAPLAVMRPVSGTGSMGIVTELLNTYGPDTLIGRTASTILGSTDTTLYIITVYFGAVGVFKPRYSLFVGLTGDLVGFFGSILFCKWFFGF